MFFVLDIKKYITEKYGNEILKLNQKTLTVHVRKESKLDEQAFYLIKQRCSIKAWQDSIAEGEEFANVFFRDAKLIWRISTADERNVSINFVLRKYVSKSRSEAYFIEVTDEGDKEPEIIGEHWEYMMSTDLSQSFPYLEFNPDDNEYIEDEHWDDESYLEWQPIELPNGKHVFPDDGSEIVEYKMLVKLNDIGISWVETLCVMKNAGFIELNDKDVSMVSVAPFHGRDV